MITDGCKDFIVFLDFDTGFIGIDNVFLVRAKDEKCARDMAKKMSGLTVSISCFKAFDLCELPQGWQYYR